ncbi:MAG: hypothetical protein IH855_02640 [Bacteroidetes bacterium]|nr:hypothetical protein [Bacteroidota bacterium]
MPESPADCLDKERVGEHISLGADLPQIQIRRPRSGIVESEETGVQR